MRCPSCACEVAEAHRFCPSCGAALAPPSERPTVSSAAGGLSADTPAARILPGAPGRGFTPGVLLAGRYRIIGLLGRGGMGEVYRADDVKLGTPVALKFLPRAIAGDRDRQQRLAAEVRMAREVTHPNVCRVFDLGEIAETGQQFLSMEYIDGEDLASLLRRIGRLPADKALDIARQLCAGLAAAHARDILHRDLKPANVMLDGRGRVRITDFGLAVAATPNPHAADGWGTPAYMAPEQLRGEPASVRTDIYALGLVLYELYTGRPAFAAGSIAELRARKSHEPPPPPSDRVGDIDPAVERALLRALAPDPQARPPSVVHLAAALPGGSALEAVIRAGETPSPELVAASGTSDVMTTATAWTLLAVAAAGALVFALIGPGTFLWRRGGFDTPPDVLAARARDLLTAFGMPPGADRASGFEVDLDHLRYLIAQDPVRWRTTATDPSFLRFWRRESTQPLEAWRFPFQYGNVSRVTPGDPPLDLSGMSLVRLDPAGRLLHLVAVRAEIDGPRAAAAPPDWPALLAHAGFNAAEWTASAPSRTPPVYADTRAAWTGVWPARSDLPVRLEAAALGGQPVYFEAVFAWTPPPRTAPARLTTGERTAIVAMIVVAAALLGVAAIVARRNVRAGRGDRRGAFRLSLFVFATMMLSWFFGESHVATMWEIALALMALAWATLAAVCSWLAYLAVEPYLRRRWPDVMITWTRLLAGELRDPQVGRDVLIGCATAPWLAVAAALGAVTLPAWLAVASDLVFVDVYGVAYHLQSVVPLLLWRAAQAVLAGLACLFLLTLLRQALRSPWAAAAAFVIGGSILAGAASLAFWVGFANTAILLLVYALLIVRVGLLAAVVQFYAWGLFVFFPVTADFSVWYAGAGVTALIVFAALAIYAVMTSTARRPAWA